MNKNDYQKVGKYANLTMKLDNYHKSQELISTLCGVVWHYKEPILTSGGKHDAQLNK